MRGRISTIRSSQTRQPKSGRETLINSGGGARPPRSGPQQRPGYRPGLRRHVPHGIIPAGKGYFRPIEGTPWPSAGRASTVSPGSPEEAQPPRGAPRRDERDRPLGRTGRVIEPSFPSGKRGRRPVGCERMPRMHLASVWFHLSDEGCEGRRSSSPSPTHATAGSRSGSSKSSLAEGSTEEFSTEWPDKLRKDPP